MEILTEAWMANRDFLETGGWVLSAIGVVTFLMWMLIIERRWYLFATHPQRVQDALARWRHRSDRGSWQAHQIRKAIASGVALDARRNITLIKTFVALCPLFGLLGTVTGMIEVFDVMAISGSGNARAMASGVSRATIPTMAGMVASLSGFIFSVQLERYAQRESERVADQLTIVPAQPVVVPETFESLPEFAEAGRAVA